MKRILLVIALFGTIAFAAWRVNQQSSQRSPSSKPNVVSNNAGTVFNKKEYSIDTPGSLWWIVNKQRPLPSGYVPANLVVPSVTQRLNKDSEQMHIGKPAAESVEALFSAAQQANVPLVLASGYRSEAYQRQLYNGYVASDGQEAADRSSAKPGTSEHQTGLAMDVCAINTNCELVQSFGDTPTGKWLAENAYRYGFVIRYLKGKEDSTGYQYEPWHLRFVGEKLAAELHRNGQTMEEFFGLN